MRDRFAIFHVTYRRFFQIIMGHASCRAEFRRDPEGPSLNLSRMQIVAIFDDFSRGAFAVKVFSHELDVVNPGDECPILFVNWHDRHGFEEAHQRQFDREFKALLGAESPGSIAGNRQQVFVYSQKHPCTCRASDMLAEGWKCTCGATPVST